MTCERCGHELVVSCSTIGPQATTTHEHTTLQCIANLRADLAAARKEIEEIEAFRAAPLATIRGLLGDEGPDEAIVGSVCARDLLMAVRRLMEAAVIAAEALEFVGNWTSAQVRTALADPALAVLRGAP